MPDSVVVRKASERDYGSIARIQQLCPEAAQWPVGDYSAFETLLAISGGAAVGFCCWREVTPGEAELLNLGVDPAWRRRGVGSALLEALCGSVRGDVFLEVAETNAVALALYRRHGWKPVGIRNGYYDSGRTNALVMKKRSW